MPREHTSHSKYSLPTTQEMTVRMDITRWSIQKSDLLYSLQPKMEKLYTVNKRRPVADSGSDHVSSLLQNSDFTLKKVEKTSRPFKYDLNQIPYDYTVEVTNRFKGLNLLDRVPEEIWMKVRNIVQRVVTKTIPKKRKYKKARWLSEEAFQTVEERREKIAKEKGKDMPN